MRNLPWARSKVLGLGLVAVVIAAGAAVVVAVAGGGSAPSMPTKPGVIGSFAYVPTASSPPPIAPSAALRRVVASLKTDVVFSFRYGRVVASGRELSDLVSARIGKPPRWARSVHAPRAAVPALYVTERIRSEKNGGTVEAEWEADLLLGAISELTTKSRTLENGVGYMGISGQLPNGTVTDLGSDGIGKVKRGQQFARANDTDTAIKNSVERVASKFGLSVESVTIFRALGAAPAVVLTAPITSAAWKSPSLLTELFGARRPRYQAYYIEVRGEDGKAFVRRAASFRTGGSAGWPG